MKKAVTIILVLAGIGFAGFAISHSGGLDAYGCHKDHATGLYHCHK